MIGLPTSVDLEDVARGRSPRCVASSAVSFARQPRIDLRQLLLASRGCIMT